MQVTESVQNQFEIIQNKYDQLKYNLLKNELKQLSYQL